MIVKPKQAGTSDLFFDLQLAERCLIRLTLVQEV
jgi:hypothetical protein